MPTMCGVCKPECPSNRNSGNIKVDGVDTTLPSDTCWCTNSIQAVPVTDVGLRNLDFFSM